MDSQAAGFVHPGVSWSFCWWWFLVCAWKCFWDTPGLSFDFPKETFSLGFPRLRKGSGSHSKALHGLDSIILKAFSQPKLFHQIPFHRFRIISLYAQAGIFQGAVKGPVLHQREQIGIFMDYSRGTCLEFCFWPFLLKLKHFQEPGGFLPLSHTN